MCYWLMINFYLIVRLLFLWDALKFLSSASNTQAWSVIIVSIIKEVDDKSNSTMCGPNNPALLLGDN